MYVLTVSNWFWSGRRFMLTHQVAAIFYVQWRHGRHLKSGQTENRTPSIDAYLRGMRMHYINFDLTFSSRLVPSPPTDRRYVRVTHFCIVLCRDVRTTTPSMSLLLLLLYRLVPTKLFSQSAVWLNWDDELARIADVTASHTAHCRENRSSSSTRRSRHRSREQYRYRL